MTNRDPVSIVAAGYDRLAPYWDDWLDRPQPRLREHYVDWMEAQLDPGSVVLELGSGTGRPIAERLSRHHEYLGIDVAPEMVKVATGNVPGARFLNTDMRRLMLPSEELDAVVAFHSIIHIPRLDQPALFLEIHRWLRAGGYLVASLLTQDLPAGQEDDWLRAGPMFFSSYEGDTYCELLGDIGFEVIEASILPQAEGDLQVRYLWIVARAPIDGGTS